MAWSSADQNPSLSPSAAYGSPNYAAQLNNAAYYNPMGSGSTMAPTVGISSAAPTGVSGVLGGETNYADRLSAAVPREPWETRETSRELATAADRTAAARRYTKEVSTTRGTSVLRQGDRAYDLLHPQTVQRFALAARQAHAEGIPVGINSAYRPPGMGIGGFRDKFRSTHAYGLGFDVSGIGGHGSKTARRWNEIATEYGLINPYGPNHRKEYNHYQLIPEKSANQIPGLRDTITASGPIDPEVMWAASGVDPEGVPYAGNPFGVTGGQGQTVMAGGNMPTPRSRPERSNMTTAYAPPPEAMESPFDAVLGTDRRPQPAAPRMRPQRDTLAPAAQAPAARAPAQGNAYTVQRGDTLSAIAQRTLGDPNRWREIAQANGIRDPNVIQPGQQLVIPGAQAAAAPQVPSPRMRPSREVDMPVPRLRPERGTNVPTPRMRPSQGGSPPGSIFDAEPTIPWQQRVVQPGPTIPRTRLEAAEYYRNRPDVSLAAGGNLGTPETQMSIDRQVPVGTPVYGNAAAVNRAGKGDQLDMTPAETGMDTSGLIREPTPEERALQMQGGQVPLPTGPQAMDPQVAAQIARTPAIITEIMPPNYVTPNGVRVWALR